MTRQATLDEYVGRFTCPGCSTRRRTLLGMQKHVSARRHGVGA